MSSILGNFETFLYSLFRFGGEKLVNIGEIPFTLMSTLALYLIARKLSFDKKSSFAAACIFITMPIVLIQSTTIMSDMFGCSFLLVAVYFFISWIKNNQRMKFMGLAALSLGISIGTKMNFALNLIIFFGFAIYIGIHKKLGSRRFSIISAVFFSCIALTSWFWFTRNYTETGSAIFPFTFDSSLIPSYPFWGLGTNYLDSLNRTVLSFFTNIWTEKFTESSGFGFLFVSFMGASLVCILASLKEIKTHISRIESPLVFVIIFVGINIGLWWFFLPRYPRFILAPLGLTILTVSYSFKVFKERKFLHKLFSILFYIHIIFFVIYMFFSGKIHPRKMLRNESFRVPEIINTFESGAKILNTAGGHFNYPLYGKKYEYSVYELSPDAKIDFRFIKKEEINYIVFRYNKSADRIEIEKSEYLKFLTAEEFSDNRFVWPQERYIIAVYEVLRKKTEENDEKK